jgi:hypothetical protein
LIMSPDFIEADSGKRVPFRHGRRRAFILVIVTAVSLLAWLVYRDHEAVRYQGTLLSDYLPDLVRPPESGSYQAATNALFAVGPRALPVVLEYLDRPAPLRVRWFLKWRQKLPATVAGALNRTFDPYWYSNRRLGAVRAVGILGTRAAPIAGQLVAILEASGPTLSSDLAGELGQIGPAIIPHLKRHLADPRSKLHLPATEVILQLGPAGAAAAPDLIAGIAGSDEGYLRRAAGALAAMGPVASPEWMALTTSTNADERFVAIEAMARQPRIPAKDTSLLLKMLDDPDARIRLQAALVVSALLPARSGFYPSALGRATAAIMHLGRNQIPPAGFQPVYGRWLEVLREGLANPLPWERIAAAEALTRVGEVDEHLVSLLAGWSGTMASSSVELEVTSQILGAAREHLENSPPKESASTAKGSPGDPSRTPGAPGGAVQTP